MDPRPLFPLLLISVAMVGVFALGVEALHLRSHPRGSTVAVTHFHKGP